MKFKFSGPTYLLIAFSFVLSSLTTPVHAQQSGNPPQGGQDAARKATCEQQRLACQKEGAQINSFGVPVTSPEKTKLCWDGYYACLKAGPANPPPDKVKAPPGPPNLDPTACSYSCELRRLACQKEGAQLNSSGVPVTPPEKTSLCWESFYGCVKQACGGPYPFKCKPDEGSGCVPQ